VTKAALIVVFTLVGCSEPAPTREYATAMNLYASTITATLDPTHSAPEFDAVVEALRTVPDSNPKERDKARRLADTIAGARAAERARAAAPGWVQPSVTSPRRPPAGTALPKGSAVDDAIKSWRPEAEYSVGHSKLCRESLQHSYDRCFRGAFHAGNLDERFVDCVNQAAGATCVVAARLSDGKLVLSASPLAPP